MSEDLRCKLCGDVNYPLSMGGPHICPACDCGNFHDEGLAMKRLMGLKPPPTTNERREPKKEFFTLEEFADLIKECPDCGSPMADICEKCRDKAAS